MVAHAAVHRAKETGGITPDPAEILDAGWYRAEALPDLPSHGSIARALIEEFRSVCAAR